MKFPSGLAEAYLKTEYRVFLDLGVMILRAESVSAELAALQKSSHVCSSAFVTAYNPLSQATGDAENLKNQEELIRIVNARWKYYSGEGADPQGKWPAEPSLLILGISRDDALMLGWAFKQHAILCADSAGNITLESCDPSNRIPNEAPTAAGTYTVNFVPQRGPASSPDHMLAGIRLIHEAATGDPNCISPKAVQLVGYVIQNNFLCPQHARWMEFWKLLPEINGGKPAAPLPLQAWSLWANRIRHEFLMRHIACADRRGVIDQVDEFLRSLPAEDWVTGFRELYLE